MTLLRPSAHAAALLLLGGAIWYAGASQGNNGAFLFGSIVTGVALVSAARTWINVRSVYAIPDCPVPVFAGEYAVVPVEILNRSRRPALAIHAALEATKGEVVVEEVPRADARRVELRMKAERRGEMPVPRIALTSRFPYGFFRASKMCPSTQSLVVYPRPAGDPNFPESALAHAHPEAGERRLEGDDFEGVRAYVPGESQRHIDWKAVARGAPLMIKRFASESGGELHLDWEQTGGGGVEERLSQLALWIVKAERAGRAYALRMPGESFSTGLGGEHAARCLRGLALYEEER